MMKRVSWLAIAMFTFLLLAGCGQDTKIVTVYVPSQVQSSEPRTKVSITSENTQELQLFVNEDGSLEDFDSGSIKVFPKDVDKVGFSSERVGMYEYSRIYGTIAPDLRVAMSDFINTDQGFFVAFLKDGRKIRILPNRKVNTYKEMDYHIDDTSGWYSYGVKAEGKLSMRLTSDHEVKFSWENGADTIYGLKGNAFRKDFKYMSFVTTNGTVTSLIQKDPVTHNLFIGETDGVPLKATDAYRMAFFVRVYAIATDGTPVELNFDWSTDEAQYSYWYLRSNTKGLYQNYRPESGNTEVSYDVRYN